MANISEPKQKEWDEWCASRGPLIVEAGKKLVPWKLYRDLESGLRCTIYGFNEERVEGKTENRITVMADFTGDYNLLSFGRRVFGLEINQLVECDLPAEDEMLGTTMNEAEQLAYINERRAELGHQPLTAEELDDMRISKRDTPVCAIDEPVPLHKGANHGEGKGQEEGRQEESSKGEGDETVQASPEAVPAQEAGPADDQDPDRS